VKKGLNEIMADGRVVYEFEADYSGLENDVKKAEQIVGGSSNEVAEKQKKNDREVADSAKQTTDEKVKTVTDGNKTIIKSTDDIKNKLSSLNKEYNDNKEHIKSVSDEIKVLEKEKAGLVSIFEMIDNSFPDYYKKEAEIEKLNNRIDEAKFGLAEFNTEQSALKQNIKNTERELAKQATGFKNVADSTNKTRTATRGATTDMTGFINAIRTGNLSVTTFSRAIIGIAGPIGIFAAALGGVVTIIKKFNTEKEEASKRLEAAVQSLSRSAEATRREYDEVSKLTGEYERLGRVVNPTADEKRRLTEIQDTLNSKYLTEAERLDLVNGKYQENLELLQKIAGIRFDFAQADAQDRAGATKDSFYNFDITKLKLNQGPFLDDIKGTTRDALIILAEEYENILIRINHVNMVSRYLITGTAEEQAEALRAVRRVLSENNEFNSRLYEDVITAIEKADDVTQNYISSTRELADIERIANGEMEAGIDVTNNASNALAGYSGAAGNVREQLRFLNAETDRNRTSLAAAQRVVRDYERELHNLDMQIKYGGGTAEAIARQAELNEEYKNAAALVNDLTHEKHGLEKQLRATTSEYRDFIRESIYSADALRAVHREANLLSSAFAEMNEHKSISIDTMLALIDAGYASVLAIDTETGAVRINAAAYRDLALAKLESQQAGYATQMSELQNLRDRLSGKVNLHNMSELTSQIRDIDEQIKVLELQNAAVSGITNSIDSVVSGNYGRRPSSAAAPRQSVVKEPTERLQKPSGGNIISITSYVPTIWDDVKTANAKLEKGLGASMVGRSTTGKLVTGLETLADNAGNVSVPTARVSTTKEATLRDVVSAINDLKESPSPKQPININLTARNLLIGRVAVDDINEMTERDGKSPLIR